MLRVLIVDDEAPARRYMRRLLDAAPDVRVEGEAANVDQACRLIHNHQPDALFLDVRLAHETGFDLLQLLDPVPRVVFVTAYSDYAAQAFDIEAVDYLLKPVSPDRLAQALARLRSSSDPYFATRSRHATRIIKASDLTLAQAQGDYVRLCSASYPDELMHTTMKRLLEQLPSPPFCSISRSMIVNLDHIAELHRQADSLEIRFNNGVAPICVGRTASLRLRRALEKP